MSERDFVPHPAAPLEASAEARNYNAWLFDRARPYLGRHTLDFGAGLGIFSELAAEAGAAVTALEPDERFSELLASRFQGRENVRVVSDPADLPAGSYDSVLCFNVLEHIADDAAALATMRGVLRPGGHLLLLVPAHGLLFGEVDRFLGHHRRYGKASLRRLLDGAALEVRVLRHVNPVGAAGWLVRFRLRGTPDEWPVGSYRLYDRLVPALRRLDRVALPVGLSLWAVARRR